jgi:hypothetical protein
LATKILQLRPERQRPIEFVIHLARKAVGNHRRVEAIAAS